MNKAWLMIVAVTLLTAISLLFWRFARATTFARPSAASALSAEVASLRADVAALRSQPRDGTPVVVRYEVERESTSEPGGPVAASTAELTVEEKLERIEEHAQSVAKALDERLSTEARDPAWGNESLSQMDASLKAKAAGTTLLEASCSATICRALLRHDSEVEQHGLGNAIAQSPPFDQGTLYRYDRTSNPPKTTLYVIRSGHDIGELTGIAPPDLTH